MSKTKADLNQEIKDLKNRVAYLEKKCAEPSQSPEDVLIIVDLPAWFAEYCYLHTHGCCEATDNYPDLEITTFGTGHGDVLGSYRIDDHACTLRFENNNREIAAYLEHDEADDMGPETFASIGSDITLFFVCPDTKVRYIIDITVDGA